MEGISDDGRSVTIEDDTHEEAHPVTIEYFYEPANRWIACSLAVPVDVGITSYATIYGGDTLVIGKSDTYDDDTVPATYEGKERTSEIWRGVESIAMYHETGTYESLGDIMTAYESDVVWKDNAGDIKKVAITDRISPKQTCFWFYGFSNCVEFDGLPLVDMSNVTNTMSMFHGCSSATTLDIASFDMSSVIDATFMFYNAANWQNVEAVQGWNMASAERIDSMLRLVSSYSESLDLRNWRVSSVKSMSCFAAHMEKVKSINMSGWDVAKCTSFLDMAAYNYKMTTIDLTGWNTPSAVNLRGMFYQDSELVTIKGNIAGWNTSKAVYKNLVKSGCSKLQTSIPWAVS